MEIDTGRTRTCYLLQRGVLESNGEYHGETSKDIMKASLCQLEAVGFNDSLVYLASNEST